MKKLGICLFVGSMLLCGLTLAADEPPKAPTTQPIAVGLADKKALEANVGKDVIVEGLVTDAQWSATGRVFLIKFKEGEATQFQGALFTKVRPDIEKAFGGDLSNAFEGAKIRITGKLQIYREHPEILIDLPSQVNILTKGPGHLPHARPATAPSVRLSGAYGGLTDLTEEQRGRIAAIQHQTREAELAYQKKLREEEDTKIAALLSEDQKKQIQALQQQPSPRRGDGYAD